MADVTAKMVKRITRYDWRWNDGRQKALVKVEGDMEKP